MSRVMYVMVIAIWQVRCLLLFTSYERQNKRLTKVRHMLLIIYHTSETCIIPHVYLIIEAQTVWCIH